MTSLLALIAQHGLCDVSGCTSPATQAAPGLLDPELADGHGLCAEHRWTELHAALVADLDGRNALIEAGLLVPSPPRPAWRPPPRERWRFDSGAGSPYGVAALRRIVEDLYERAKDGRNNALNRAAWSVGRLVEGGEIEACAGLDALREAALQMRLPAWEAKTTIRSGLSHGAARPRSAPEQRPAA